MADFIRIAERVFYALLAAGIIIRFLPALPYTPQVVVYIVNELIGVIFILIQRRGCWAKSAYATMIAFIGTSAPLLVNPVGVQLAPYWLSTGLMLLGASISIGAKLSLRRSFGLIAANRGIKTSGLYRFVRHPIYTGYLVSHIGFLLLYCSSWNLISYLFAWTMLWLRAKEEEKFLLQDVMYQAYTEKVRARVVPGLI